MREFYVHFGKPSGQKIMYISILETIGVVMFRATTVQDFIILADAHLPEAVDFSDSRFPRHAVPTAKAIEGKLFDKYVRLNNKKVTK